MCGYSSSPIYKYNDKVFHSGRPYILGWISNFEIWGQIFIILSLMIKLVSVTSISNIPPSFPLPFLGSNHHILRTIWLLYNDSFDQRKEVVFGGIKSNRKAVKFQMRVSWLLALFSPLRNFCKYIISFLRPFLATERVSGMQSPRRYDPQGVISFWLFKEFAFVVAELWECFPMYPFSK